MKLTLNVPAAGLHATMATRQLSGVLVPYGPIGRTSAGPLRVRAGSLTVDPVVVLLTDHDTTKPAGILATYVDDAVALTGVFKLPAGVAQADDVLAAAAAGLRPGLSVGLDDVVTALGADGVPEVVSARVVEVSSVVFAAFSGAHVTDVAAMADETSTDVDSSETSTDVDSSETSTDVDTSETSTDVDTSETSTDVDAPDLEPAPTPDSDAVDDTEQDPAMTTETAAVDGTIQASTPRAVVTAGHRSPVTLAAIASRIAALQGDGAQIQAALTDITTTTNPVAPEYISEVFGLVENGRPITQAFERGDLTSNKVSYRKWTALPVVDLQSAEKAEIASGAIGWAWDEALAKTYAGGNDVSLQDIWFDASALTEYFRAAAEAYAIKADAAVAAVLLADGTPVHAGTTATTYTALYLAGLTQLLTQGLTPNVILGGSAVYVGAITEGLAAAKLGGSLPIATPTFIANPAIPAGTLIIAHSSAAKTWEVSGSPVRMQVANVAQAGVDVGVVGALATAVLKPGAVAVVSATAA